STVGPITAAGSDATPPRPDEPARAIFQVDERRLRGAFLQLCEGIQALHDARILHRAINPSHVLITRHDTALVLDFGLAPPFSPRRDGSQRRSGIAGTPAYMAPEQWIGKPESEASDWYSVGVMLYEALTRQRPFVGEISDILQAKAHLDPTPPS